MIYVWIVAGALYIFVGFILPELLEKWIDKLE